MPRKLQAWTPTILLGAGCAFLFMGKRQVAVPLAHTLSDLPSELLGFSGKDVPVDPQVQQVAGMSSFVLRQFQDGTGRLFSIYVGYYEAQTQGHTIHSPKNCLPGAGWEPITAGTTTLPGLVGPVTVNRYYLGKETATALVYYWYQGRGRIASNEYRVKWDLLRDKALRGRSEEALVRIVVPVTGTVAEADTVASQVAALLIPQVEDRLPKSSARGTSKSSDPVPP